jgi:hypothetical protein
MKSLLFISISTLPFHVHPFSLFRHENNPHDSLGRSACSFPKLADLVEASELNVRQLEAASVGASAAASSNPVGLNFASTTSSTTVAIAAAETGYPGTYYRGVSPDGTCGANVGYSCLGSVWGNCCRFVRTCRRVCAISLTRPHKAHMATAAQQPPTAKPTATTTTGSATSPLPAPPTPLQPPSHPVQPASSNSTIPPSAPRSPLATPRTVSTQQVV